MKRRTKGVLCVSAAMVLIVAGTVALRIRNDRAEVDREVAALRVLGVPTTAEQMHNLVTIPDADNAAAFYREAFASLEKHGKTMPAKARGGPDPTLAPRIRQWVLGNGPTLELARKASLKPGCDFGRKWELGIFLLLPEFAQLKTLVKLAVHRAGIDADAGRFEDAMGWLQVGQRVARHADEPILIGALVSIACDGMVHKELQRELELHGGSPKFRGVAATFLSRELERPAFARGLIGEVLAARVTVAQLRSGELKPEDVWMLSAGGEQSESTRMGPIVRLLFPLVSAQVEAKLLRRYRQAFEQLKSQSASLESQMRVGETLDRATVDDRSVSGRIAEVFVPVFAQVGVAIVKTEAMRRLSRVGLALWTVKAQTGHFPPKLPSQPWALDPYTNKPFVYRPSDKSFKLYSVGSNRRDEGGARVAQTRSDDVQYAPVK